MNVADWKKPFDFDSQYGMGYDFLIRAIMPDYDSLFPTSAGLLTEAVPENGRVLVVGCGTGTELEAFARMRPNWSLTGVDTSPTMISTCREKLAGHPDLFLHEGTIETLEEANPFDGSTSILVMHFIKDDGSKLAFLRQIRSKLRTGAMHIHLDAVAGPGTRGWQTMMRAWKRISLERGLPLDRWESLQAQIDAGLFRVGDARMEELFREAGFTDIQRFWMSIHHIGWLMTAG
jgi:tRNA (cmo5U34)-methyltransferase